jgi:hypothetical protein
MYRYGSEIAMITVKARFVRDGRIISDNETAGFVIKNESISNIIDNINYRLSGENNIE